MVKNRVCTPSLYSVTRLATLHDAGRRWITPGLIDCHTHLVYAGDRAHEFELLLEGASYEEALTLPDTDWHLPRLYDFAGELGASLLIATHSRYVIDLNRAPDGVPLYRGTSNTELCPTTLFSDRPIYLTGEEPDEAEIETRREELWSPYHRQLSAALDRMRELHGVALLFDAHSIRSEVPRFFQGRLPALNLGSGSRNALTCTKTLHMLSMRLGQPSFGRFCESYSKPCSNT